MSEHDLDCPLSAEERELLAVWADPSVPADFSDRVISAWQREAAPTPRARRNVLPFVAAIVSLSAALLTAWLVSSRETPTATGSPRLASAHFDVRDAVTPACRPCHAGQHPEADPAALAAFDMDIPQWWTTLSHDRVEALRRHAALGGDASPSNGDGVVPSDARGAWRDCTETPES